MPIVSYIREHTRFIEYASDEKLSSGERLLWYALMHIFNQRAQGSVWPDDFVRISNERLLSLTPMKFDTLADARNRLRQRGLIDVIPGEKNKKSPAYKMIYFCPQYAAETETDRSYPKISDNMGGNMGYKPGGNIGYNPGGSLGDIRNKPDGDKREPDLPVWDEEEDEEEERACAQAHEEAVEAWIDCFGKPPSPAIENALATSAARQYRFGPGVIRAAVNAAAIKNAASPADYIQELFRDWAHYHVKTGQDAAVYCFLRESRQGKHGAVMPPDEARRQLEELRKGEGTPC